VYPLEAAVELLIRALDGRLLHGPWIVKTGGHPHPRYHFDGTLADVHAGVLSGGERRVLAIAASLTGEPGTAVTLDDVLSGLDRDTLAVVLAAVAHAAGTHDHSRLTPDPNGRWVDEQGRAFPSRRLGPLYAWPAPGPVLA
jgi:hypothetical protein